MDNLGDSRGRRMLQKLNLTLLDKSRLDSLNIPKYESTKGLELKERTKCCNQWNERVREWTIDLPATVCTVQSTNKEHNFAISSDAVTVPSLQSRSLVLQTDDVSVSELQYRSPQQVSVSSNINKYEVPLKTYLNGPRVPLVPYTDSSSDEDVPTHHVSPYQSLSCADFTGLFSLGDSIKKFDEPRISHSTNASYCSDLITTAHMIQESDNICNGNVRDELLLDPGEITFCEEDINQQDNTLPDPVVNVLSEENNNTNSFTSSILNDSDTDPEYLPDIDDNPSPTSSGSEREQPSGNNVKIRPVSASGIHILEPDVVPGEHDSVQTKRSREKDFCFYCENWVTTLVQKIASNPIKSVERKELLSLLRKKGNYLATSTGVFRTVRKPALNVSSSKPLPCTYCLGLYSRKQLWRHRKKCSQNPGVCGGQSSQAAGQTLLTKDFKSNVMLREKVFVRMRADDISLAAKKDTMICAYGTRYLLTHRKHHQYTVCSLKMRKLSRLLIRVKKIEPKINSLLQALKPEHFDVLVEAARLESGHNKETDVYGAPTFGMNIGTSLKECCEIGITEAMKKKHSTDRKTTAELESELRTTILLINSNWNVEVSHQAANSLYLKKMNKVTIVPLASDLKSFKEFLVNQGNEAAASLTSNEHDRQAFQLLTETVYCRVLLLCRKRVGELQRLPLEVYQSVDSTNCYEEFSDVLRPTEMLLIRKFKRVVIQGKRKVTPVLFSFDVQEHISLIIKVRRNFVQPTNSFLFASSNSSNPIVGYKVLGKHANKAGLKNPQAFTSRRLRKHLATISQLLHMTDQDIEQISSFMGHTSSVHRSEYRLPDDVYQTSKVAKLLMAMESGEGAKNKRKTLDEIEVNLEDDLLEENNNKSDHSDDEENVEDNLLADYDQPSTSSPPESRRTTNKETQKKPKRELVKWSREEKVVVANYFRTHISNCKPPRKHECEELMKLHSELLHNKTWVKVKVLVQNLYTNKTKLKL